MNERAQIERALYDALGGEQRDKTYDAEATAGALLRHQARRTTPVRWEREEPISHQRGFVSDVVVPFAQSLVTGGFVGAGILLIVGGDASAAGGAGLLSGLAWWLKSNWNSQPWVYRFEQWAGVDLDGDGHQGQPQTSAPPSAARTRPIIASARDGVNGQPITETYTTTDVSNPDRRLARDLAEFLVRGDRSGFGRNDWTGQELSSGTVVTDPTWREWVGDLVEAGILESNRGGTRLVIPLDDALKRIF